MFMRNNKFIQTVIIAAVSVLLLSACATVAPKPQKEFNPKTCFDDAPRIPSKIKVLQGPRPVSNIAFDMHPSWCNGQVLLKNMYEKGSKVSAGTIVFKITVEYTGEVISVRILESDIQSNEFIKKISDMIMDTDFTSWARHDQESVFIYPMTFDLWWE